MSEKKRRLVAYHEAGHAILGALMNDMDVVVYSLLDDGDDKNSKLCLGAVQEDGHASPSSAQVSEL